MLIYSVTACADSQLSDGSSCGLKLKLHTLYVTLNYPDKVIEEKYELWLPDEYMKRTDVCGKLTDNNGHSYTLVPIGTEPLHMIMNPGPVDGGLELIFLEEYSGKVNVGSVAGPLPIGEFEISVNNT